MVPFVVSSSRQILGKGAGGGGTEMSDWPVVRIPMLFDVSVNKPFFLFASENGSAHHTAWKRWRHCCAHVSNHAASKGPCRHRDDPFEHVLSTELSLTISMPSLVMFLPCAGNLIETDLAEAYANSGAGGVAGRV